MRIRLAMLTVLALVAVGCGGGSETPGPEVMAGEMQLGVEADAAPMSDSVVTAEPATGQDDPVEDEDPLAEERRQAEQAIAGSEAEAARQQAVADMAADKAERDIGVVAVPEEEFVVDGFYRPYYWAEPHVEFDGEDVRVHLPDYFRGYPVVLSSVQDKVDSKAASSRLEGYRERTWTLSDGGPLAVVSVRWSDEDDGDYLAAGWWVREPYGSGEEMEVDVFVDGPELRGILPNSMTLPLKGKAVYRGEASGVYTTEVGVACTAFPCDIPTSSGAGEFAADAKLVADFMYGDIEGCVGCREGIQFTSAAYDLETGAVERRSTVTKDYLFWLHRAGFLESPEALGSFAGALTVAPLGDRAAGYGYWQGRFSNVQDAAGSPRLLGATLHGEFEDGSATTRFSGVLSAESMAFEGGR